MLPIMEESKQILFNLLKCAEKISNACKTYNFKCDFLLKIKNIMKYIQKSINNFVKNGN